MKGSIPRNSHKGIYSIGSFEFPACNFEVFFSSHYMWCTSGCNMSSCSFLFTLISIRFLKIPATVCLPGLIQGGTTIFSDLYSNKRDLYLFVCLFEGGFLWINNGPSLHHRCCLKNFIFCQMWGPLGLPGWDQVLLRWFHLSHGAAQLHWLFSPEGISHREMSQSVSRQLGYHWKRNHFICQDCSFQPLQYELPQTQIYS